MARRWATPDAEPCAPLGAPRAEPSFRARAARRNVHQSGGTTTVSTMDSPTHRFSSVDAVAGVLAVGSIVLSAIGMGLGLVLELDARPSRLIPVAVIAALVAARMSPRFQGLALKAVVFAMVAWVVGMTVAVVTENPLI